VVELGVFTCVNVNMLEKIGKIISRRKEQFVAIPNNMERVELVGEIKKGDSSYHQSKEIIEKELTVIGEGGLDVKPEILFSKEGEKTKISFGLKNNFDSFEILSVLSQKIGEMTVFRFGSGSLFLEKNKGLCVSIHKGDSYIQSKIEFETKTDLKAEEIEAIISVYKTGHEIISEEKTKIEDPRKVLESLGATVFNPENVFDWDSLAGYEKVKKQIKDTVILPLRHPDFFDEIIKMTRKNYESIRPKAVLFEGPPGTGKTTMARLIASETEAILVYVPIESIVSKWYGQSEKNLEKIFNECAKMENSILFLDEIDSLAISRDGNIHEATRRTLSVLLRKIDGFNQGRSTILIGATNQKNDLDSALLSRFNISIGFNLPDLDERKLIIKNYAQHLDEKYLNDLANKTENFSGRDIKNLCERVERSYVSELICNGSILIEPPPGEKYLAEII